jgi:hypothetical protein
MKGRSQSTYATSSKILTITYIITNYIYHNLNQHHHHHHHPQHTLEAKPSAHPLFRTAVMTISRLPSWRS